MSTEEMVDTIVAMAAKIVKLEKLLEMERESSLYWHRRSVVEDNVNV